jgi:hypothetical protein
MLDYGGSAALGDNFPGLGSANPIAGTFPLAVSLQFAFNAADTSKYFDPKVPPPGSDQGSNLFYYTKEMN